MSHSKTTIGSPWWESELPAIRDEQIAYLRKRLPALRADHEDLVGDTLVALIREIQRHSSIFPGSWFQLSSPESEVERLHLRKLALVILKRRISDLFRKRLRLADSFVTTKLDEDIADPDTPTPERRILLARMLEVTLSFLERLQPADRDLIAFTAGMADLRKALDSRERQRLHRLRQKLSDELVQRLGADAASLLQSTE